MGITDRPFAGTWRPNLTAVVKYTPDVLVYINGDTSIPGCPSCRGKIDMKNFITSVSIEAGTDPGAHSANISLLLPRVQGEQLFIDGKNKLQPGLEVHIFMKGYFSVKGQFEHLSLPDIDFENATGTNEIDFTHFSSFPYYPVFHGVITSSTYDYADGSYHGSLNCASLLHFWQYQNITSNAAVIAARPNNSPGRTSLFGHNFNNMHPFGIIYTLYKDVAGAAMAVEFALDEQSNLSAVSADGDSQLFDQVAAYWEQRFKTRIQSLRMYGVNGQLFNAAQQAFLASASNRDIDKLLSNDQFSDSETQRSESDPFSASYSIAKALGLANGGLDLTFSSFINETGEQVNLNLLDMYAFTQEIGDIGNFNVFESTYQTKMEVAQQVTEVTGYEFYQDVDGDLVFKPPFYNLDTSTNRIYRLETIDIQSINFTDSEPQATYISVRGSWFKGLSGVVPNNGVTGKRGLYVDYKLVAKFGWRPSSWDVTYTTDSRILFFIGVARMDILNIGVHSASCSIPIRPEMKPGYPVYIPFIDSYYYVSALSHSFAFGGACTTSLTLTARRCKFDAPGERGEPPPGLTTVDLIKLDRGDLPSRQLVIQNNGMPRMVGFPNVVLALDPTKSNPQFFPVGVGIDHINSVEDVGNFLNFLREDLANLQPQVLEIVQSTTTSEGVPSAAIANQENRYRLRYGPGDGDVVEFDLQELVEGFNNIDGGRKALQSLETEIRDKQYEREAAIQRENVFFSASKQSNATLSTADRARVERELGDLQARLQTERERLNTSVGGDNKLIELITALQKFRGSPSRRKIDGLPGSDVSSSYFDSLLNLKSQYMASDLPGRYRYYSCSHPNPEFQGQPIILFDDGEKSLVNRNRLDTAQAPTSSPPLTEYGDGLPSDPEERLRAKLEILGVDWMDTRAISAQEGISRGIFPEGSTKGSQGIFGRTGAVPANLDEQTSNNLANIIDVANQIRTALLANPAFSSLGFTIGAGSSWRPDFEDEGSESMHALGRAIDIGLRPGKADLTTPQRQADFRTAFDLLKVEAMRAYQEKRVNFVQVYQDRDNKPDSDFVHIDQRTSDDVALVATKRGLENTPENVRAGLVPGTSGFVLKGKPFSTSAEKSQELARLALLSGYPGKGVQRGGGRAPKQRFPLGTNQPATPPPAVVANPASGSIEPELVPRARVEIREATLPVPRKVIQFIPPKAASPDLKVPEAELGVGECVRGLNIAQGPGVPPQILTTDQIQNLCFSHFSSTKFVDLIGTSVTTGSVSINSQGLFVRISDQFAAAAQDVLNFDQTPEEVFKTLYDELSLAILEIDVPNFQNGVKLEPLKVTIEPFDRAVPGVPITPSLEAQFPGVTIVPVYSTSFRKLASVPGFASSVDRYSESQNLGTTVNRTASAYANALTKAITKSFDQAKLTASEPAEGKPERLAEVQAAFQKITDASMGVQPAAPTVGPMTTQDKTPASSKTQKSKHAPVFPVSDEKGYEHYGAFRYGRGLTVDAGGTFEFLHQDGDPFQNVTAQTVEEFLRVLTLVKSTPGSTSELDNIRKGQVDALQAELQRNPNDTAEPAPALRQKLEIEQQSFPDLNRVAFELSKTAQGQEALDELLRANGDNLNQGNWDISDTQFARRFSNFSANYAKSPVFKTTITNAAVQLMDLVSFLDKTTSSCSCVAQQAFAFFDGLDSLEPVPIEGVDAAVAWSMRKSAATYGNYLLELKRIRGELIEVDTVNPALLGGTP